MRNQKDQRITDYRNDVEDEKRAAMSPTIDKDSAAIGVDGTEQGAQRVVKTDNENARAERLQIFRHKTHPEFLARTNHENGDE